MLRLFTWLSAFVIGMILIAGVGVYWLSASDIDQARQQESEAMAKNAASSIATHIRLITATLDKMAQDPEVFTAVLTRNKPMIELAATKLEQHLPDSLKIRLLPADIKEPDESASPRMGFADLEMARAALSGTPPPAIQGENTDRHLAIARKITLNDKVSGVILASLDYSFTHKYLNTAANHHVALELRQSKLVLAKAGSFENDKQKNLPVPVPGTDWIVAYQTGQQGNSFNIPVIFMIILPAFFGGLAFYVGYRGVSEILSQDVQNLMKMFKDMMTNNLQGSYPFHLGELSALFSNLLQFKRVLEKSDPQTKFDNSQNSNFFVKDNNRRIEGFELTIDDDLDLNGLFDDNKF